MIREKSFYRAFFTLTFAVAMQNLLTLGVNMMDTVMLGRYSQDAMSAVSLCNQVQFFLQMLVTGAGEGAVVLGAQYWGKNRLEPIRHIIGAALRFGVVLSAALFFLVLAAPEGLLRLLSSEQAVIDQGVQYFRIVRYTYVVFAVTHILAVSLRSVGAVGIGYILSLSTLCINTCLNFVLIYGRFGFPELGVRGAAAATLISRCAELAVTVYYLKYRETHLGLTLRNLACVDGSYVQDYIRVCLPVLVNQALWGAAQMVQTGILGRLGGDVTAANAIAVQVYQVFSVAVYGAAAAAAVMVGRAVGSGERKTLRPLVATLETLFTALGILSAFAIFLSRGPVLAVFGDALTARARVLALQFLAVIALTTSGTAYQMCCDSGIIRGGGDTAFSARMNLVSMWGIVVPLSALAAFRWSCPPAAVFFLLKWDQLYKIVPVALRLHSWRWVRNVTRPEEADGAAPD